MYSLHLRKPGMRGQPLRRLQTRGACRAARALWVGREVQLTPSVMYFAEVIAGVTGQFALSIAKRCIKS